MAKRKKKKDIETSNESVWDQVNESIVKPSTEWAGSLRWKGNWTWLLAGVALGFSAAFILDPVEGRHRRSLIRDKSKSLANSALKYGGRKGRDLQNRTQDLMHKAGKGTSVGVETGRT